MKKLLVYLVLIGCTRLHTEEKNQSIKYLRLNDLWENKSSKEVLIKSLGTNFKDSDSIIVYPANSTSSVDSVHWFENDILAEQVMFLDENSLKDLKSKIICDWDVSVKSKFVGHTFYKIEKGSCLKVNIFYQFLPGKNSYEVRWKK